MTSKLDDVAQEDAFCHKRMPGVMTPQQRTELKELELRLSEDGEMVWVSVDRRNKMHESSAFLGTSIRLRI